MPDKVRPYSVTSHDITDIGRFRVVRDKIAIDGQEYPYSYLANGSFVVLLPIYHGQVVYIHQYRHTFNDWFDELPGGGLEEGESPEEAAARELREETGFSGKLVKLCELPGSQGTSIEMAYIYLALCDSRHASITEPTELIEVKTMPEAEFGELVHKGRLRQLAGIVAWYYYELRKGDGFDA